MVRGVDGGGLCSRRRLLQGAGAGTAASGAILLAGCGSTSLRARAQRAGPVAGSDVELLNGLLDLENQTIAAYTAGIPLLGPSAAPAARQFLEQELSHAGELAGLVKQAHAKPLEPNPNYNLGHPRNGTEVLMLLHELERRQLTAYFQTIPRIAGGSLRASVATIVANDAQHISILRSQLGLSPVPAAFASGNE